MYWYVLTEYKNWCKIWTWQCQPLNTRVSHSRRQLDASYGLENSARNSIRSPARIMTKPSGPSWVRHVTYKHNRTLNTSKRTSNRTLSPTLKRSAPSSLVKRKKQELQRLHSNWAIELFARNFQVPGRPIQDYCPPLPQLRGSEHCLGTSRTKIYVFFLTSTRPPSDCTFRVPFVSLQSCYAWNLLTKPEVCESRDF